MFSLIKNFATQVAKRAQRNKFRKSKPKFAKKKKLKDLPSNYLFLVYINSK